VRLGARARIAIVGAGALAVAMAAGGVLAAAECYRASTALLVPRILHGPGDGLDPESAAGLPFRTVDVPEPLGPAPAWLVPGAPSRWAIVVHGMGAPRAEGLPLLPALHDAGLTALIISYRNDPGAPGSPDGLSHLGADEWRDLDAAARFAVNHGARHLTLAGYSMGGAMVCDFLRRSPRARLVTNVVLDAPVLEWRRPLAMAAARAGVPQVLVAPTEAMVDWRTGIDLSEEDQLGQTDAFGARMLVLHGTADSIVPIADSRALARAIPGRVRLVEFAGAGHAASWQSDPGRYDAALAAFLGR